MSICALCFFAAELKGQERVQEQTVTQPNIILILADDIGFEAIRANGGESYETPHLDQMARKGIRFEHCHAQPLCTPSRVQLMTGQYNVRNYAGFGRLSRSESTFAHLLKDAGYATCIAGKWQLGSEADSAQHFGFDESLLWQHVRPRTDKKKRDTRYPNPNVERNGKPMDFNGGEYGPDIMSDYLVDFMTRHKEKPFFVYYPMLLPHCPFVATPDSPTWDGKSQGSKSYKGDAAYFGDMVNYMDKTVGKLVEAVDQLGIASQTIILFIGDNGTDQPVVSRWRGQDIAGGKGMTTDAGTHVPFLAYWPGTIPEGLVSSALIDFSDFFPSIMDIAQVTVPQDIQLDGLSFFPQLIGQDAPQREWIYSWYHPRTNKGSPQIWARNHRFKLYADGKLFDVENDPLEQSPLTTLEQHEATQREELQQIIDQYKGVERPSAVAP